jgi:hypothetical protein
MWSMAVVFYILMTVTVTLTSNSVKCPWEESKTEDIIFTLLDILYYKCDLLILT